MSPRPHILLIVAALGAVSAAWTGAGNPARAQPAGAVLYDPVTAGVVDPYAIQPNGYFAQAPTAGLIDRPLLGTFGSGQSLFANPVPYRGRMFLRGEYLGWWTSPLETPALVTTNPSGTPRNQAGFLGGNDTSVLFGGDLNDAFRSGVRIRGGWYVDPSRYWGIGGDYYQLFGSGDDFSASSDGSRILARPFYDIVAGRETAELIGFPGLVAGNTQIESDTRLRSFGIHVQADALNPPNSVTQVASDCGRYPRLDWTVGYRNMMLDDELVFTDNLTSLTTPAGTLNLRESFETENRFQGLEFGIVREIPFGRWWFESVSKIAVGNNAQRVRIAGTTRLVEAGVADTFEGGLLAQRSNIGMYERDRLSVVPELGATLGFHVTPRFSLTAGYTFVYFSNVVRAGDQIDTDINPGLIPVEVNPLTGPLRPRFEFRQSDFYAHGVTVGGDFRF